MITELKPTNLIAVEVPIDSFGFYTTYEDKYTSLWLSEPKNEYESPFGKVNEPYNYFPALFETSRSKGAPEIKILGEVTKDKIGFNVEPYAEKEMNGFYKNYSWDGSGKYYGYLTPYDSFRSLLAINGLYFENPIKVSGKHIVGTISKLAQDWQSFEDKLIKGKLLILEKI